MTFNSHPNVKTGHSYIRKIYQNCNFDLKAEIYRWGRSGRTVSPQLTNPSRSFNANLYPYNISQ